MMAAGGEDKVPRGPLCTVCGVFEDDHEGRRHAFTPPGMPVDVSQFDRKRPTLRERRETPVVPPRTLLDTLQTPFDPVLRQALLDKGVLTVDDLESARRKIAAMTEHVLGGGDDRLQRPTPPDR